MKLISMVDYILQIDEIEPKAVNFSSITDIRNHQLNSYSKIVKYAEFLKQQLELWMFVPCDENGTVLERPCDIMNTDGCRDCACRDYKKVKERVLFEGFEIAKDKYLSTQREFVYIPNTNTQVWRRLTYHSGKTETFFFNYYEKFTTIENLIEFNLTLTPNAIKQLGL